MHFYKTSCIKLIMEKAQGSLTYILLIAGAIVVAAVVLTTLVSLGTAAGEATGQAFPRRT